MRQHFQARYSILPKRSTRARRIWRLGYTLLELMLALALLAALMTVAWSLMGTYRDAEQRGWKLSHRTQSVRSTRQWLEGDLQHLVESSDLEGRPNGFSNAAPFVGDASGFTAAIAPSLDPRPFLQILMGQTSLPSESDNELDQLGQLETNQVARSNAPWPSEIVEIEYRLEPQSGEPIQATELSTEMADESQYALVRRERHANRKPTGIEQVLTSQDLYRLDDDSADSLSPIQHESRVEGLMNVRFHYHDGIGWKNEWNGTPESPFPVAVALSFDFPSRSQMSRPTKKTARPFDSSGSAPRESELQQSPFRNELPVTEPTQDAQGEPEIGPLSGSSSEVQIVIWIGSRQAGQPSSPSALSLGGSP